MDDDITDEQKEMLEYMAACTELDPPDVAAPAPNPDDGWDVDGDGE